ncbi:MAG: hypothetical protein A2Y80_03900 [Deltaproteobacteria bacterium RBG_13_58_19]|nr:MAG: hypothetical protein A2Y80_03900 [Deltaproteobacteria bacterium RBG_13_58_19]
MSVNQPGFTIPRRSIAGMEGMYAKMWDPPKESPLTPEYIAPTNPVPEFMQSVIPGFSVSQRHTVQRDLLHGLTIPTWETPAAKNLMFMTFRDGDNPFDNGSYPGGTIRVPRGVIYHCQTQGHGPPPHTIHWHGIEPTPMNDGVGHCSMEIGDYLYQWQPNFIGTYFYHCHRNTVQHFEFGLFGMLLIEPPDAYANPATAGGYPRRTAANLADFPQFADKFVEGDPVNGVGIITPDGLVSGDPHAFTVEYDVEALWVLDDRDSVWSDKAPDARTFYPALGKQPGVDDKFFHGFFHDYNADYWFVTGVPVLGHRGEGSLASPVPIQNPALVFGTADGTIPAALNSGVTGMQVAINANVGDVILVRCLDAAYNCISVTFPVDVIIIAWDGRALGVPPFGKYNHAYVVPAGTPIHTSTARRYDALIRVDAPFSGFATVQFIDTHGQNIPGRAEPVLVTAKIPITIL